MSWLESLPVPDSETAASFLETGLESLASSHSAEIGAALSAFAGATNPVTAVAGTILISGVCAERATEIGISTNRRLNDVVEGLDESDARTAALGRTLRSLSMILPKGKELEDASQQAVAGEPDRLVSLLEQYAEDDETRREFEGAVERLLSGEAPTGPDAQDGEGIEGLREAFGVETTDEAVALFLEVRKLLQSREVHETLETAYDIELEVEAVESELRETRRRLERQLDSVFGVELQNQGFVRLNPYFFEEREPDDPARCWRTGFELVEVQEGYCVPREREREDGTRVRIDRRLREALRSGTDHVVLGSPGSGKSTICKQVACEWYAAQHGPVFYRSSGQSQPFTKRGTLENRIQDAEGEVLVVVEDAIRDEADEIFGVIQRFKHDDRVSFLLDARENEWHSSDTRLGDARLQELKSRDIVHHNLPRLDERECERMVAHYESTTGADVRESPAELFRRVTTNSGVGEVLQLSYHLSFYPAVTRREGAAGPPGLDGGPTGRDGETEQVTLLEHSVRDSIREHRTTDVGSADLPLKVGLLINLLNATDVGVYPELLHALAASGAGHREVERVLDRLEGDLVFVGPGESVSDVTTPFRSHHEFWSSLYLQELLDVLGEREAQRLFEECVNAVFAVFDDADLRDEIERWFRAEMDFFDDLDGSATAAADSVVESVFELARRQPILAPLFAESAFTALDLPAACSPGMEARTALWRGIIYYNAGTLERSETELRTAQELVESADVSPHEATEIDAWCTEYLGNVVGDQGDLDRAREYHREASNLFRTVDDQVGRIHSLINVGHTYQEKGAPETAHQALENAIEIAREAGANRLLARAFSLRGLVAKDQGRLAAADEYLSESLSFARDAGAQREEDRCLNHLGLVAKDRSDLDDAEGYFVQALKLAEKIGDQQGRAFVVHNLGDVAFLRGDLETASTRFTQSLEIEREIGRTRGEAISHNYLAKVEKAEGSLDRAEEHLEEGLELIREVGDKRREAQLLKTAAIVAKNRGHFETAEVKLRESLGLYQSVGDTQGESEALRELGSVSIKRDEPERAEEFYEESLTIEERTDDPSGVARCFGGLGLVAQRTGDLAAAERRYEKSRQRAREAGDREGEGYALQRLGQLKHERGANDEAVDRLEHALDVFESLGDERRQARSHRSLGVVARSTGDLDRAERHLETALAKYREVGDAYGEAQTTAELGKLARERGDDARSHELLRDSVRTFRSVGTIPDALECLTDLIDLKRDDGERTTELREMARELEEQIEGEA